ncbi:hypothetical protein MarbSA_10480 [Methanobrevibacter arboriphilus]|uniref:Uncharacterized protein n=1 Tax=Methanobrevibacter arboriphilus TaxID=39441 RepID=A0ACA8R2W2_METAZ|nr:hypothetical protein MarbSA_10480 [Methanobrevibacter arboriphilus]
MEHNYLLKWHIDYYSKLTKHPKNTIYQGKGGEYFLTIQKKKEILLNNIYGVDIDTQAVEVTKLSLLLKVLENENKDALEQQKKLIQERVLPYLGDNIRCGNSLIGTDILENNDLTQEEIKKINPFDWEEEFHTIMTNGGFDAIIGNPPYVGQKNNNEIFAPIFSTKWGNDFARNMVKVDLFYFFFHKSIDIAKKNGLISFITTNYFLTADGAFNLRKDFKERTTILKLLDFNELKIFENAKGQHNIITILKKKYKGKDFAENLITKNKGDASEFLIKSIFNHKDENTEYFKINQNDLFEGENNYLRIVGSGNSPSGNKKTDSILKILNKISDQGVIITKKCDVKTGLRTGIDKVSKSHINKIKDGTYKIKNNYVINEDVFIVSNEFFENTPKNERNLLKPLFKNSDIKRYSNKKIANKYVIYSNKNTLIDNYPFIKKHLLKFKPLIKSIRGKNGEKWYSIVRSRENRIFNSRKIVIPQRSKLNDFSYNECDFYASSDVYFIIDKKEKTNIDLKYVLALINSKLYYNWFNQKGKKKGDALELYQKPLSQIPIKDINKDKQQPFIDLVDKMIQLNQDLSNANNPHDKKLLEKQIEITDDKINRLIYELYKLSPKDIEIIENSLKE